MQTRRRKTSAAHERSAPERSLAPAARPPAVRVPVERLAAERPLLAALVRAGGVAPRDREDVIQAVLLAAWMAAEEGRYRPKPSVDPRRALRGWLHGIVWRQTGHYRHRAWVRREIPVADPWSLRPEPPREDEQLVGAREHLLAVRRAASRLRRRDREVLALAAVGHGICEIARALGLPISTAVRELGRARRRLRVLLGDAE